MLRGREGQPVWLLSRRKGRQKNVQAWQELTRRGSYCCAMGQKAWACSRVEYAHGWVKVHCVQVLTTEGGMHFMGQRASNAETGAQAWAAPNLNWAHSCCTAADRRAAQASAARSSACTAACSARSRAHSRHSAAAAPASSHRGQLSRSSGLLEGGRAGPASCLPPLAGAGAAAEAAAAAAQQLSRQPLAVLSRR